MKTLEFELMPYQEDFVFNLEQSDQGFKGGFRAGKSEASVYKSIFLSSVFRGKSGALLSPTYGMTKRNIVPIFRKLVRKYNLNVTGLDKANPESVFIKWGNKTSEIFLNITAENHDRLNGVELAWCGLDEADKCLNHELAETAWIQMGSRLSGADNGYPGIRFATSTPEGFGFMYNTFGKENDNEDKVLYTASMLDNYMLPEKYIEMQLRQIPKHLHKPYIEGEFANIFSNVVYCDYDRDLNHTPLTLKDMKEDEVLHVGMDFNNNGMSAIGFIIRDGIAYVIYENIGAYNTKTLAKKLALDLQEKKFMIYPDPACTQNKSSADSSDLEILRKEQFRLKVMNSHPEVQDRVNSVNARFCNALGERKLFVNRFTCPLLSTALLQQIYNSAGEPQKKTKLVGTANTHIDGPLDALGYPIYMFWPLKNQRAKTIKIIGY